ncbi:MAG: DNA polymerase III subunit delta [Bacteroidia bacterium]|nr:DNA polymerase III subunit delta [Bacteroidia bacterium]
MDYIQIIADLKMKEYSPVYFLEGEEPYFMDRISDFILENVLTEEEKGFNQTILYGKDLSIDSIMTAAKRFPMMADRQVVVIREAQNIKNIEDLAIYVENPMQSTILVFNYKYKSIDKRKKLYKALQKNGIYFESKSLYDNKVPAWISEYLKEKNLGIDPRAAQMITDFVGSDLQRIVNELEKVTISLVPGTSIMPEDVEKNIGISKDYNVFELQKALGNKDILKSNRIINYFIDNEKQNPLTLIIGNLVTFFRKILIYHSIENKNDRALVVQKLGVNPFFINDYINAASKYSLDKAIHIISMMREYDLRSKGARGGSTGNGDLLRELVYKILHI